ncbi:transposase [Streptomyces sp. NPDC050448]|uniref:transposase n=1 Tax=Streptomyces sp. NPDC050448 TaxID=3155404 RepID=UPI00342B6F5C
MRRSAAGGGAGAVDRPALTLFFTAPKALAEVHREGDVAFHDLLAHQTGRKVHVIVDRHPVHRGETVRAWLHCNADRIELHLMPGYSPELNSDELLNADLEYHVHAARVTSIDDLARETRRSLHRGQRQPGSSAAASPPGTSATQSSGKPISFGSI